MGKSLRHIVFLLLIGLMGSGRAAVASVWTTQNHWNDDFELQFGQWVHDLPMDIFTNPNSPYHGIATDCADAAYTIRTIFASQHGLPVKFQNSERLSNDSAQFDSIADPAARIKKFIQYVNDKTDTKSLPEDTYPIAINRAVLKAGALFLHAPAGKNHHITNSSGHVYYVADVPDNGIIRYIGSTVPQAVRVLSPRYGVFFAPENIQSGYRAWKWPDSDQRPGLSDEQFHLAGWRSGDVGDVNLWQRWQQAVQSRVRSRRPTTLEQLAASRSNLEADVRERVFIVLKGWHVYQTKYMPRHILCMSASDYEDYSTPTRDVRIQQDLSDLHDAAESAQNSLPRQGFFSNADPVQAYMDSQKLEVMPGTSITFAQAWQTFMTPIVLAVSEPEHSPAVRWGLQSWTPAQWPCPQRIKQYDGADTAPN